jgi:RimJ/RimL family protein N-acetyltransferase
VKRFQTERLIVREWTDAPADLARIYDTYSRWEVVRWLGANPRAMAEPVEAEAAQKRWHQLAAETDGRYGAWAIEERDTGLAAGTVLYKPLPNGDGDVEVGWHLHPDSWGFGYATEAARGAIQRGLAGGDPEVYCVVRPDNAASLAVCRRLGLTPLGRTTRWYGVDCESFRATPEDWPGTPEDQKSTTTGA